MYTRSYETNPLVLTFFLSCPNFSIILKQPENNCHLIFQHSNQARSYGRCYTGELIPPWRIKKINILNSWSHDTLKSNTTNWRRLIFFVNNFSIKSVVINFSPTFYLFCPLNSLSGISRNISSPSFNFKMGNELFTTPKNYCLERKTWHITIYNPTFTVNVFHFYIVCLRWWKRVKQCWPFSFVHSLLAA